ncbi:hypothetical protein [Bartonella sp. AP88XZML]|uniref:hypothetical protein n=1 Tax=Bartonella sp. AP88XZML TaxID=3243506 RepID=UPI0035CEA461
MASPEFLALWEKINKKTTYRAKLDRTEFVAKAVDAVEKMAPVAPAHLVYQTAEIVLSIISKNTIKSIVCLQLFYMNPLKNPSFYA